MMRIYTLNAGTMINVGGTPVVLEAETKIRTFPTNWVLIQDHLKHMEAYAKAYATTESADQVRDEHG